MRCDSSVLRFAIKVLKCWLILLAPLFQSNVVAAEDLPEDPTVFMVSSVNCAQYCAGEKIQAGIKGMRGKQILLSNKSVDLETNSCVASRAGDETLMDLSDLIQRWPGFRAMKNADSTRSTIYEYRCGDEQYHVIAIAQRLFIVTNQGLLLTVTRPAAAAILRSVPGPVPPPPGPVPRVSSADDVPMNGLPTQVNQVKVFFGTNRSRTGKQNVEEQFGVDRGELVVGQVVVTIPPAHKAGEIEQPSIWRFELSKDPLKHMVLVEIVSWPLASFRKNLQQAFLNDAEGAALLFIHGYNVSFENAALRTAQMAWDLKLLTAPLMFSWPSRATLKGYAADEEAVNWAVADLKIFVDEILNQSGAKKIHVIAHSMGNRALVQALQSIAPLNGEPRFNEIILAAPDIDADIFKRDIAPAIKSAARRHTIYTSSNDKALKASKKLHAAKRLGDADSTPLAIANFETIDASAVDTDFLGHSYFADEVRLLKDIGLILKDAALPEQRNLKQKGPEGRVYWSIE